MGLATRFGRSAIRLQKCGATLGKHQHQRMETRPYWLISDCNRLTDRVLAAIDLHRQIPTLYILAMPQSSSFLFHITLCIEVNYRHHTDNTRNIVKLDTC